MDIQNVLLIMAAVNRFTEAVKPSLRKVADYFKFTDEGYAALVQFVAVLTGILIGMISQVNLLSFVASIPAWLGVIITGAAMGLGADVLNAILDLLYSWQKPAPTAK